MRSISKIPWIGQPEAARLPISDRPRLRLGVQDARLQWLLLREASRTAPDSFRRFIRRITWTAVGYLVLLCILMGAVIAGVPVDNRIQGLAVFGTATVSNFYQNVAGPLLQYHKTHGKPSAPAEVESDQWQEFRKAFWWSVGVGAGGTILFTVVGTWLASVYAYLGLPNTVLIAAIAQPWQIAYGLFATYIFGRGSRKLSAEAKAAREAGRKLREGVTWRQRREYRRQAKPFMGRLWPLMIGVTLLFWLAPALLVLKLRPSSRWQSLLLVWFLLALVTFAQKVCVEPFSTRVQLRATKGHGCVFPEDYVWSNAGTFDLLRTAVRDLCNMWLVNGVVTLVLDGGLNNQSSLMHYCLNLVLVVGPGTVISALIAGWPGRADQAVAQVRGALSGGKVPPGAGG